MNTHAPAAPGPLRRRPAAASRRPGTARTHVRRLRQDGSTYPAIATAAGLAPPPSPAWPPAAAGPPAAPPPPSSP